MAVVTDEHRFSEGHDGQIEEPSLSWPLVKFMDTFFSEKKSFKCYWRAHVWMSSKQSGTLQKSL